jgi:hypothetical protein
MIARTPMLLVLGLLLTCTLACGGDPVRPSALPEGFGLSAKYPGDKGLAKDPAVLFAEDFEEGSLEAVTKRWDNVSNQDGKPLALSTDVPAASSGKHSLEVTATLGQDTGGHLYTRFPGVDKAYLRFYVKFMDPPEYLHHFVTMGGYNPPTPWPQGGAGVRPEGNERAHFGIEPTGGNGKYPAPGAWNFYTYWQDMKISADGKYWGNGLDPIEPQLAPAGRWQCVEVMMKMNSAPEAYDGELALWLDGKLVAHFVKGAPRGPWSGMGFHLLKEGGEPFEGFRWRNTNDLKINFLWLMHYVTENVARYNRLTAQKPVNRVWFDDVVVSREYIGPIKGR